MNIINELAKEFNMAEFDKEKMLNIIRENQNKKDFKEALSKLQRMDFIIREKNYPMEVDTLIALLKTVKEKLSTL